MKPLILSALIAVSLSPISVLAQEVLPYQLRSILGQYTEVYGGVRDGNSLSSLRVEGSIAQDGRSMRFTMLRKRPNLFRYRLFLNPNGGSVTSGYDGRIGWIRKETDQVVETERLSGAALEALKAQGRFESPLFRYEQKDDHQFKLLSQHKWQGQSVRVVEVIDPRGAVSHYFLDTRTAHVLRIDRYDNSGEIASQTLYRDYREVKGFPFAHEVEQRAAGETVSIAKVESISVNPGVLSFYFEEPSR